VEAGADLEESEQCLLVAAQHAERLPAEAKKTKCTSSVEAGADLEESEQCLLVAAQHTERLLAGAAEGALDAAEAQCCLQRLRHAVRHRLWHLRNSCVSICTFVHQ
jgi:hypothetical protein